MDQRKPAGDKTAKPERHLRLVPPPEPRRKTSRAAWRRWMPLVLVLAAFVAVSLFLFAGERPAPSPVPVEANDTPGDGSPAAVGGTVPSPPAGAEPEHGATAFGGSDSAAAGA